MAAAGLHKVNQFSIYTMSFGETLHWADLFSSLTAKARTVADPVNPVMLMTFSLLLPDGRHQWWFHEWESKSYPREQTASFFYYEFTESPVDSHWIGIQLGTTGKRWSCSSLASLSNNAEMMPSYKEPSVEAPHTEAVWSILRFVLIQNERKPRTSHIICLGLPHLVVGELKVWER